VSIMIIHIFRTSLVSLIRLVPFELTDLIGTTLHVRSLQNKLSVFYYWNDDLYVISVTIIFNLKKKSK